jgi:DNA-binding helix-hairpin-helix protein with protein kinase domain/rRNA maturation protein Nop10
MVVYDTRGGQIRLGNVIGRGGEAAIHRVTGRAEQVAKIYSKLPHPGQDQKLAWMLAHPPADPTRAQGHSSISWPLELLYDAQKQFVGYLMPYVQNAVPLLEVFNPRLRAQTLPGFNRRYLHRTARNLAAALGALHARDYVVGDLNESNVMVTPSALVTLIDSDSFQVQELSGAKLVIYPCLVGKAEYTSPELQGRSFRGTQRLPEHDCFGLGVLIFQLLMDGNHPFRSRWLGQGDPPPVEEKIRKGWFPHVKSPLGPVAPPPNVPALDTLHPRVASLARRCFVQGDEDPRERPTPGEWEQAIAEAEAALVTCRQGHYYAKHLDACPRCGDRRSRPRRFTLPTYSRSKPVLIKCSQGQHYYLDNLDVCPHCGARRDSSHQALYQAHPRPSSPKAAPAAPVTKPCPNCGHVNDASEIYCQSCARQLATDRWCSNCNGLVPKNAHYCTHCGHKL